MNTRHISSLMPPNTSTISTTSSSNTSACSESAAFPFNTPIQTPSTPSAPVHASRTMSTSDFNAIASFATALSSLFYFTVISFFFIDNHEERFVLAYFFVVLWSCSFVLFVLQQQQSAREDRDTIRLLDAARIKGEMDEAEIERRDVQIQDMGRRLEAKEAEMEGLRRERDEARQRLQREEGVRSIPMFVFGSN